MPCFHCHVVIKVSASHSAFMLGTKKTWPNKVRRRLGIPVESRAEANRRTAVRAGNARPEAWGKQRPQTIEDWQAWAFDREQKRLMRHERAISWAKAFSYYWKNRPKILSQMAVYARKQYKNNPQFRFKCLMRNHVKRIFKKAKTKKEGRTIEYLGCSMLHARNHIEKKFKKGMHWSNHGAVWHIDHIIPLAAFDLTDPMQRKRANHFTNLQPLPAAENMHKRDKITQAHQLALL